jgi:vacuolar-type H+-ATPase subunit H
MTLSKTTLAMTFAALSIGLSACTDTQKETAKEAETEAKKMMTQAKEKSADLYDKTKEGASELADKATGMAGDVKDKADNAYDATAEKAAELKTDAAEKLKEACIVTKKKLGKDPEDC